MGALSGGTNATISAAIPAMAYTIAAQEVSLYNALHVFSSRFGGIAGFATLLLSTVFSYLKLDTATKGYYSGRLKLLAVGVLIFGAWMTTAFIDVFE